MSNINYTHCPACCSSSIHYVLTAKDYTVSNSGFPIWECENCSLRFTQNIPDAAAIGAYYQSEDYISHSNTSKGFINKLYQLVRKRTLIGKRKLIQKITGLAKGNLLDIGSGVGSFVAEMKTSGWSVTGLEPDEAARAVAATTLKIELKNSSELFALPLQAFDAITMWHVLEHVHELQKYMQQLKSLLAPNGKLFIAVPNYTAKEEKTYKENWAAYDVPRHLYHFSPMAMEKLLQKNGLQLLQCKPMWFDSFYISLLSSKYKNGRSNLLAAFFYGLSSNFYALTNVKKCSSVIYIIEKAK